LLLIASGKAGFDLGGGFASNGYAAHSRDGYSLVSCFVAEVVLTFFFLMIIMGATDRRAPSGFAPIAIAPGLTLIHLIGIPVTNLSVNPVRSTGTGHLCWRMGTRTTLVVLGGADHRLYGGMNFVRCDLRDKDRNGRDSIGEQESRSIVACDSVLWFFRVASADHSLAPRRAPMI
jgi:hypothetical protein